MLVGATIRLCTEVEWMPMCWLKGSAFQQQSHLCSSRFEGFVTYVPYHFFHIYFSVSMGLRAHYFNQKLNDLLLNKILLIASNAGNGRIPKS